MKVAKYVSGTAMALALMTAMALALMLTLVAARPAKADDTTVPEGRVAVTYEYQVDWVGPLGQSYHTGYTVTVWWDNGQVVQKRGYDEAMADYQGWLDAGWTITNTDGPYVVGVTPW